MSPVTSFPVVRHSPPRVPPSVSIIPTRRDASRLRRLTPHDSTPTFARGRLPSTLKTYVIVWLTCLVIGSAGYALYGDQVMDEVTLNLPAGVASTIALALITVNPFSKFALTMDPVRLLPTTPFAW